MVNFLAMDGVPDERATISRLLKNFGVEMKHGDGHRALVRQLYKAPPTNNLTSLIGRFNNMTGFMLVRHPFERLVSAYEVVGVSSYSSYMLRFPFRTRS